MNTARSVFGRLMGVWALERTIDSRIPVAQYVGRGTAEFTSSALSDEGGEDGERVVYRETLELRMEEGPVVAPEARQEYVYALEEEGRVLTKYFSDGRVFYKLEFDTADTSGDNGGDVGDVSVVAGGKHLCVNDWYESSYEFVGDSEIRQTYCVTGPEKDYTITTILRKQPAGPSATPSSNPPATSSSAL